MVPVRDTASLNGPRQSLPPAYRQNGAIYVINTAEFLRSGALYLEPFSVYKMSSAESVDIDTAADFQLCKERLSRG